MYLLPGNQLQAGMIANRREWSLLVFVGSREPLADARLGSLSVVAFEAKTQLQPPINRESGE
jgi:hypothetical protein